MSKSQQHLNHTAAVNLGAYYTPEGVVDLAYSLLQKNIADMQDFTVVDSSCGYGSFLRKSGGAKRFIGADVDATAIAEAKKIPVNIDLFHHNSLCNVSRQSLEINHNEKIIALGNPPYNDTTSILRHSIKNTSRCDNIDADLKTRDLGMSFLLSYDKLKADYVCVLHPLSYLIKKTNFNRIAKFAQHYQLMDGRIISSREFSDTSRGLAFPILIALYERKAAGMSYDDIRHYQFKVRGGGVFCLQHFDTIDRYVAKYPNKKRLNNKPVAKFWTLRDINALRRNKTFIDEDTYNTVYVSREKLPYYCYIDIFKQYADKMPYFIGNCDVIIDHEKFSQIQECFIAQSVRTNPVLRDAFKFKEIPDAKLKIDHYFKALLESLENKFPRAGRLAQP